MDSTAPERRFRACAPSVVSEVIDGEAVIMDLRSGHYYSARASGALIWEWIGQGCDERQILALLDGRFTDAAAADVAAFIELLLRHGLIQPAEPGAPAEVLPRAETATRIAFVAPVLEAYTDMQDLLLLDPIHDVAEAGWPTRKTEDAPE